MALFKIFLLNFATFDTCIMGFDVISGFQSPQDE